MKLLFTNPLAKTGAIIVFAMAGLLSVGAAHAVGTASGTPINNISLLSYSVGGTPQNQICSSLTGNSASTALTTGSTCGGGGGIGGTFTAFTVDNKVNLQVATTDTTFVSVVPGLTGVAGANPNSATQVTRFTVTNMGNGVQDFSLTPANLGSSATTLFGGTDNFDGTACVARAESGGLAGYDAGDTADFIDELSADATGGANVRTVYVICAIPVARVNNDVAVVSLTATARVGGSAGTTVGGALIETTGGNTAGVDIVFADGIGTETATDLARDATYSARSAFRVVSAALTVTKTVEPVCDPLNGNSNPKNIPGTFVRYTITVANGGSTVAALTTISDTLVLANVDFDVNFITGATAAACVTGGASANPLKGFKVDLGTTTAAAGAPAFTARTGYPKFFTSASDGDGVTFATPTITATFLNVLDTTGSATAGELRAGESVAVSFQVQIK